MNTLTKFLSLCLTLITLVSLTACSSKPAYSLEDSLSNGYAMLSTDGETSREFTIDIVQGDSYQYIISGRIKDEKMLASLTVIQNGLKNNYKNLFLVQGDDICINMNSAMSAVENELDFIFTDSSTLQGKYLTIPSGKKILTEYATFLQETCFSDIATTRKDKDVVDGNYDYNYTYDTEQTKTLLSAIMADVDAVQNDNIAKLDQYITNLTGTYFPVYDKAMSYWNNCIDIDTEKKTNNYDSFGTHEASLMSQELAALATLLEAEGSYFTEGISYSDRNGQSFTHAISFFDKDSNVVGSITLSVNETEVEDIKTDSYNYIVINDFLDSLLENVRDSKGVGYETNDIPFTTTYTANQLVATEVNDCYKAVHVFDFMNQSVSQYTVTYYTYEAYIHKALQYKCTAMNLHCENASMNGLATGEGSGILQYTSTGLSGYNASDPIALLSILQEKGVPSYVN